MKFICVLILSAFLLGCGGGGNSVDTSSYPPTTPSTRYDALLYGYYLTNPTQVAETISQVNMLWEAPMFGEENLMHDMETAKLPTILDVGYYNRGPGGVVLPDAEDRIRAYFTRLQARGVLKYVVAITAMDEPDHFSTSEDILKANAIIRKVAKEFPELSNVKMAVIFAGVGAMTNYEDFDWIGFDNYDPGDAALTEDYKKVKALLKPGQRTILVPGGANNSGRKPATASVWVDFALHNSEVIAVVPFIWYSPAEDTNIIGIKDWDQKIPYCQAGKIATGKPGACS